MSKEREFKIEVYKEQVEVMKEFIDYCSKIATEPRDSSAFKDAQKGFNKMRAGNLYLFSDDSLQFYAAEYFSLINKFIGRSPDVTQSNLIAQSFVISNYCKKQIVALTKLD